MAGSSNILSTFGGLGLFLSTCEAAFKKDDHDYSYLRTISTENPV